jgi:tRNA A37 threonylcarbamoyladenosine modification protein TsaB
MSKISEIHTKPYLVLDASSKQVQGGLFLDEKWLYYFNEIKPSLEVFHEHLPRIFEHTPLTHLSGIIFNEGPGSTLGIRTVLTYIRTWMKLLNHKYLAIYSYQSLPIMIDYCLLNQRQLSHFHIISPSRKDYYHFTSFDEKQPTLNIQEIHVSSLNQIQEPIFLLPQAKLWNNTKEGLSYLNLNYNIEHIPYSFKTHRLIFNSQPTYLPFEHTHHQEQYIPWTPKRHHA